MERTEVDSNAALILEVPGVHPATGLASDYLNHFYEPLLLLEHLGDDPDLLDDLAAWTPNSYVGHFGQSGRAARHYVLAAHLEAQPLVRRRSAHVASNAGQAAAAGVNGVPPRARRGATG